MAVDVCSASEVLVSPRISFSHDLKNHQPADIFSSSSSSQTDQIHTIRSDQFLLTTTTSTFDFDFCIASNLTNQISSADELFSNGKILPTQIKKPEKTQPPERKTARSSAPNEPATITQKKRLKEFLFNTEEEDNEDIKHQDQEQEQEKSSLRSFWQFRRSTSLNCDNGRGTKGLLRSLSLKGLSRSNSTGSTPNPKKNVAAPKVIEKSNSQKQRVMLSRSTSSPSNVHYYGYNNSNNSRRPPLKKNCRGGYGGVGIRISPVLNIPPAGTMNLFGLGSLFCSGKSKKKNK